jgi:hypothetical protein
VGLLVGPEALLQARALAKVRQPPSCLSVSVPACLTWVARCRCLSHIAGSARGVKRSRQDEYTANKRLEYFNKRR